jgi:hypothetical protein
MKTIFDAMDKARYEQVGAPSSELTAGGNAACGPMIPSSQRPPMAIYTNGTLLSSQASRVRDTMLGEAQASSKQISCVHRRMIFRMWAARSNHRSEVTSLGLIGYNVC